MVAGFLPPAETIPGYVYTTDIDRCGGLVAIFRDYL
jgi:hypothetical protein